MAELLRVEEPQRRIRRGAGHPGSQFHRSGWPVAGAARPQRRRQDDPHRFADRRHHPFRRQDRARRRGHHGSAATLEGAAGRRLDAAGAQHLPLAHRRREPDRRRTAGPMDGGARLRAFSKASGTAKQHGPAIVGRGAANAGDRPRAGPQSAPLAARRADRRPRPDHRRRTPWARCANSPARAYR